jgi:hypothetical protein
MCQQAQSYERGEKHNCNHVYLAIKERIKVIKLIYFHLPYIANISGEVVKDMFHYKKSLMYITISKN